MVREGTGLEGEKGGKMREKGWEERGPKAASKNSDVDTPLIYRGRLSEGAVWEPSGNPLLRTSSENPSQNPFLL